MSVHPVALFILSKCPQLTLRKQVHLSQSYLLQSEELRHILCGHHPDMFCGLQPTQEHIRTLNRWPLGPLITVLQSTEGPLYWTCILSWHSRSNSSCY